MGTQDRVPVTVRLSVTTLAEIERLAEAEERDRSSMVRILLREAVTARQYASGRRTPRRKDA